MNVNHAVSCHQGSSLVGAWNASCSEADIVLNIPTPNAAIGGAMRIGLYLDMRNPPQWRRPWARHYGRWIELIEEADRLGTDSIWLSEHHFFEDGYLAQPLVFAAAVAARTKRARIGTAVMLPALKQAAQLAEEAALVDLISDGRL